MEASYVPQGRKLQTLVYLIFNFSPLLAQPYIMQQPGMAMGPMGGQTVAPPNPIQTMAPPGKILKDKPYLTLNLYLNV